MTKLYALLLSLLLFSSVNKVFPQCNDSLLYATQCPLPISLTNQQHINQLSDALDSIRAKIPEINTIQFAFKNLNTDSTDWIAVLNLSQQKGYKAIAVFVDSLYNSGNPMTEQYRPVFNTSNSLFDFTSLGDFISCQGCITHPALYAVNMVDEPWHPTKLPRYTTDTLKMMYTQLKSLSSTNFNIFVAFSRQLWTQTYSGQGLGGQGSNPLITWRDSLCDIVQISTLEFQNNGYGWNNLDGNHYYSRKIIDSLTPGLPLWTSVQVFGSNLGPNVDYWYPYPSDLNQLMDSVTDTKYQNEYPLTGLMFQTWDSPLSGQRSGQYTLGDATITGNNASQITASQNLINAINQWIAPCLSTGISEIKSATPTCLAIFPNPSQDDITIQMNLALTNAEVIIYNIIGQEIERIQNISGWQMKISTGRLTQGTYLITIKNDHKIVAAKFIVD